MKENNQELVKEIKNNKEEIVMNDNKEVKETGAVKAPIIPEDIIGDFEEEIDQEEKERLEREFNKTLEPIGAEVREKIKEIQEKELEQERLDGLAEMQESLQGNKSIIEELEQKCKQLTEELKEKDKTITNLETKNTYNKVEIYNSKLETLSDIFFLSNLTFRYYIKRKDPNKCVICKWETDEECLSGNVEDIQFILEKIIRTNR